MDRIHITCSPKISSRICPGNRQGPHEKTKTSNLEYQRKTKKLLESLKIDQDLHPPIATVRDNKLFAYHAALNMKDSTIYVDFNGKIPIKLIEGNTDIFVLCDWSSNAILATPVKYLRDESAIENFKETIMYLKEEASNQSSKSLTM